MAAVTSLAYNSLINHSILGVEILILAPPGYAQDALKHSPNHYYGVICDVPGLTEKASLSFIFLPPREHFFAACLHHGVQDIEAYYQQYLQATRVATYVITSGDTLLLYQRFIEKAIQHYFDGQPIVPLPILTPSYATESKSSVYSEMVPVASISEEASSAESSCASIEPHSSELMSTCSAVSSPDLDVRQGPSPSRTASTLFAATMDYNKIIVINGDVETADCQPTSLLCGISARFVRAFNIISVPVIVGIPTERGLIHARYFGGNFMRIGSIYISLLVICEKRFDNGTVQFSPPDWLVP